MSTHEGVSCDACKKTGFRGRRFKCLICYDFDLCGSCYEKGSVGQQHRVDHPMQCILARDDLELFYGGEGVIPDRPQSFVCPYCGKLGFTETELLEHLNVEHIDMAQEVVCPVCAAIPGGEPNRVTNQLATHLALDHGRRDAPGGGESLRRGTHQGIGRTGVSGRPRRSNISSGLSHISAREAIDPIAELLSQLGGIRRTAAANSNVATAVSQIHQFQQAARMPRRIGAQDTPGSAATTSEPYYQAVLSQQPASNAEAESSKFLLPNLLHPVLSEKERAEQEVLLSDRALFLANVLLATTTSEQPVICDAECETQSAPATKA